MPIFKNRFTVSFLVLSMLVGWSAQAAIDYKNISISPEWFKINFRDLQANPNTDLSRYLAVACIERPAPATPWLDVVRANGAARGPARWSDVEWRSQTVNGADYVMDTGRTDLEGRFNESACAWFWPNASSPATKLRWRSQAAGENAWTQTVTVPAFTAGAAGTVTRIQLLIEEEAIEGTSPDANLTNKSPMVASHDVRSGRLGNIVRRVYQDPFGNMVYDGAESNNDEGARAWQAGMGSTNADPSLILAAPNFTGSQPAVLVSSAQLFFDYEGNSPLGPVATDDLMGLTDVLGGSYSNLHMYLVSANALAQQAGNESDVCRSNRIALGDIQAQFVSTARVYGGISGGFLPGAFWSGSGDLAEWFNTNVTDSRGIWEAGNLGDQYLEYDNLPLYPVGLRDAMGRVNTDVALLVVESDESARADLIFCNARIPVAGMANGMTLDNAAFNNFHQAASSRLGFGGDPTFFISFETVNTFETFDSRGH